MNMVFKLVKDVHWEGKILNGFLLILLHGNIWCIWHSRTIIIFFHLSFIDIRVFSVWFFFYSLVPRKIVIIYIYHYRRIEAKNNVIAWIGCSLYYLWASSKKSSSLIPRTLYICRKCISLRYRWALCVMSSLCCTVMFVVTSTSPFSHGSFNPGPPGISNPDATTFESNCITKIKYLCHFKS